VPDLATPTRDFNLTQNGIRHRVAPEMLELEAGAPALRSPGVPGCLEEALREVLQHEQHPSQVRTQFGETHRTIHMPLGTLRTPHDVQSGICSRMVASQLRWDQKT
jgi:hypothetical protein